MAFDRTSMKISSLVERIDAREIRLPEIQRDYVWKSHQIAKLLDSLYRKYPSGSLLLWGAPARRQPLAAGGPGALRRSRRASAQPLRGAVARDIPRSHAETMASVS